MTKPAVPIPTSNSFALIAPPSPASSLADASDPVTPTPLPRTDSAIADHPKSERGLRWQKQIEEVREEERRAEERTRSAERQREKGKQPMRTTLVERTRPGKLAPILHRNLYSCKPQIKDGELERSLDPGDAPSASTKQPKGKEVWNRAPPQRKLTSSLPQ